MKSIREIRAGNVEITQGPIVYFIWVKTEILDSLFATVRCHICIDKVKIKEGYSLVYIGKALNGSDRLLKYHILDFWNFHKKGVLNGRLSSLRQTICALMGWQMSDSKEQLEEFMDQYFAVEWLGVAPEGLRSVEVEKIKQNYLPLNYHHTGLYLSKAYRKVLTTLKKNVRY